VPNPVIQSIIWLKHGNTPTEEELAEAIYHGTVKDHARMRSKLVQYEEKLGEGPLWKLLKWLGLVGEKKVSRMAFEEHEDYLLPEDVPASNRHEKDTEQMLTDAKPSSGGPRGPSLILSKHVKFINVPDERAIWKHVEKINEVDFFDTSRALWEVRILRTSEPGQRDACVFLISHIIGDGISLMKVSTGLFQAAGTGEHLEFTPPPRLEPNFNTWIDHGKFLIWNAWMSIKAAVHVTGFLFISDTPTELKVGYYPNYAHVPQRAIQVFKPLSMSACNQIRAAAKEKMKLARKPTINDLLHSLFAGTAATYLAERNDIEFVRGKERARRGGKGVLMRIWTPYMVSRWIGCCLSMPFSSFVCFSSLILRLRTIRPMIFATSGRCQVPRFRSFLRARLLGLPKARRSTARR
jgi:hypothetical protein